MTSCGNTEKAILCARGCGFYGTPSHHNLCSQCYTAYLKEEGTKIEVAALSHEISSLTMDDDSELGTTRENNVASSNKQRCMICNKKVGLIGFSCRCSKGMFCKAHRYPEEHACTFDFKSSGRLTLAKQNPLCKADKLGTRI